MNRNVTFISILSLGLLLGACSNNSSSQEETLIVKTATASTYSNETVKEFPIITQPFRTTELSFRVSGPIDRLDVYAGNYYRRGDIIAEIAPRDYRIRRERAEAVYRQAKAEYERISALYQKTIFLPVLTRKHGRNILLPRQLLIQRSTNWKIPG